jgi:hypothetical protein
MIDTSVIRVHQHGACVPTVPLSRSLGLPQNRPAAVAPIDRPAQMSYVCLKTKR